MSNGKKLSTQLRISRFTELLGGLADACADIKRCHEKGIDVYLRALQLASNLAAVLEADKSLHKVEPNDGNTQKEGDPQGDLFVRSRGREGFPPRSRFRNPKRVN